MFQTERMVIYVAHWGFDVCVVKCSFKAVHDVMPIYIYKIILWSSLIIQVFKSIGVFWVYKSV